MGFYVRGLGGGGGLHHTLYSVKPFHFHYALSGSMRNYVEAELCGGTSRWGGAVSAGWGSMRTDREGVLTRVLTDTTEQTGICVCWVACVPVRVCVCVCVCACVRACVRACSTVMRNKCIFTPPVTPPLCLCSHDVCAFPVDSYRVTYRVNLSPPTHAHPTLT